MLAALTPHLEELQSDPGPSIEAPRTFVAFCDWLGVELTPAQRVLSSVAYDGVGLEKLDEPGRALARDIFGALEHVPPSARAVVAAVCGGRAGKSYVLVALRLVWGMYRRDLASLAPGQQAVALVVAPNDKLRQEVVNYAIGAIRSHPDLRTTLRLPRGTKDDDVVSGFAVDRPDGRRVAFEAGVATRGGYGGRGRSLTDFAMDEAAFFRDASYKVNDEEIFKAAAPRVLPGGQTVVASTPWAESGLLFGFWERNWQKPTDALVAHAPTLLLRPEAHEIVEREIARDPQNADREFGAKFMKGGSTLFFEPSAITAAVDETLTPGVLPEPGDVVAAGADFGFRSDSSSLALVHRRGKTYRVAEVLEMRPEDGVPLRPSKTVEAFAAKMRAHGAKYLMADGHYRESIAEHLSDHKLAYAAAPALPAEAYMRVRAMFRQGSVKLPNNPRLIQQLREVQGRPLPGGGMSIVHPRWSKGGHGDIADAVVYALHQLGGHETEKPEVEMGSEEWEERAAEQRRRDAMKKRETGYRGVLGWSARR